MAPNPRNGITTVCLDATLDTSVVREIWHNSTDKIVRSCPYASSDIQGTSGYILDLACRISPPGIPQAGVALGFEGCGTLASYAECMGLLFGKLYSAR